ncbi:xylulokinase [Dactylosporangium sp. CA-092794]|uniref:xylulokinase n=1 Tax=Dactylosporangium sp. CA-092794 TaxID=3239929 RepID=UPI003D8BA20C
MSAPPAAVLGVDLGTSVVKASLFALDGTELATASRPIALRRPAPGHAEQDLDEFYTAAAAATRQCLAAVPAVAAAVGAIAVAGQMAGVGLVDAAHRPLAPFDSWLDIRCAPVVEELHRTAGARIAAAAGCAPTISIGPKMLWWLRHQPRLCGRAAKFVTAAGYVAGRLAGLPGSEAFIDGTHLHFTAMADVGTGRWDGHLVAAAGMDPGLLPRIVESSGVVGELTPAAAADFGLRPGTPVAAGCGDTAAGALGAGVLDAGQAFDIAGTAAVFGVCLPAFTPDTGGTLMTMRSALPGRWYSLSYVGGAGQLVEWICREMLGHAVLGEAAYADLAAAAAGVAPGSAGLILSPHFEGRVAPAAPAMRGAVIGLSPVHGRGHLARAALEAIAFEYRRYAEVARALAPGSTVREVIGTGGGTRIGLWNQIKADVLATAYRPVTGVESGARGAALVAMAALGEPLPPLPASAYGPGRIPDPHVRPAYDTAYGDYQRWSDRLVRGYQAGAGAPDREVPDRLGAAS